MKGVIFGAGKIARGFVAHLLQAGGYEVTFVEVNPSLVQLMNKQQKYRVHVMGASDKNAIISDYECLQLQDTDKVAKALRGADVAFTSVGGKHLTALGLTLGDAFGRLFEDPNWTRPLTLVTCENWKEPALSLREAIRSVLPAEAARRFDDQIGVTEAVVMRSAVEPTPEQAAEDPLGVYVQDYWELPVDRERFRGTPPSIPGVRYIDGFAGFLERKFYTYNAANGTVSYLGCLRGHRLIAEAASDPEIVRILDGVYRETGKALARKYGILETEQLAFADSSRRKLQDRSIIDYVERNARDPIRKLGQDDRLVGSARLCMNYGVQPVSLATAIAAAIYYESGNPDDPSAPELKRRLTEEGIDSILYHVCGLPAEDPLAALVKEGIADLKRKGWLK
ncbi:hypothetical protein [Cohnella silvisoli]|uniref:Mannitol dehydrogenase n=1 Tax=Cohnella silvisoli TaxID=2873699 RepID=A0ABV1KSL6_9BACL|nr:hypothetical protein [Cohnella silvisoli]MCD9021353.1 hypothetical protein [Cohnella silvisoli]